MNDKYRELIESARALEEMFGDMEPRGYGAGFTDEAIQKVERLRKALGSLEKD